VHRIAITADVAVEEIDGDVANLERLVVRLRPEIEQVVLEGNYKALPRRRLNKMLDESSILRDIKHLANEHASAARAGLEMLPDSEYRSSLDKILNFVIERNS